MNKKQNKNSLECNICVYDTCLIPGYFSVIILSMSLSKTMLTWVCSRIQMLYSLSVNVTPGIPDRNVWSTCSEAWEEQERIDWLVLYHKNNHVFTGYIYYTWIKKYKKGVWRQTCKPLPHTNFMLPLPPEQFSPQLWEPEVSLWFHSPSWQPACWLSDRL